jgi:LacI family transcriptional regulator
MSTRVSLEQVAKAAGVSKATVCKVIRNYPRINAATRRRVQALLKRMHYVPHPALSEIAAARWRASKRNATMAIAWVGVTPERRTVEQQAAANRCRELGYRLCPFYLKDYTTWRRLEVGLRDEGIRGIILSPPYAPEEPPVELHWPEFAAVACTRGWHDYPIPCVEANYFGLVTQAWNRLWQLGYRRIGAALYCHSPAHPEDVIRHAALHECQARMPAGGSAIPIHTGGYEDHAAVVEWYRRHQPDAVMSFHSGLRWWLRDAGVRIPAQAAFVSLLIDPNDKLTSGMRSFLADAGRYSVHMADELLRHQSVAGLLGRFTVLLDPVWQDGRTAPARKE